MLETNTRHAYNIEGSNALLLPGVCQHISRQGQVRRRQITALHLARLLPVREAAIDERERLLLGVLLEPAHVLGRLPPVQRMRQRDRSAHEYVVQHHERGQRSRRAGLREACSLQEKQGPQRAEGAVLRTCGVEPAAAAVALALRHKGAQSEFELGHVARKLQLARFVERLDDRDV